MPETAALLEEIAALGDLNYFELRVTGVKEVYRLTVCGNPFLLGARRTAVRDAILRQIDRDPHDRQ